MKLPAAAPAANTPLLLMVPPPLITDQVGVIDTTLFDASWPTAVNCCVAPAPRDAGFGVTTICVNAPGFTKIVPTETGV